LPALKSRHQIGPAHSLRNFRDRIIAEQPQLRVGTLEIERDDDVTEVEEDGFDHYLLILEARLGVRAGSAGASIQ